MERFFRRIPVLIGIVFIFSLYGCANLFDANIFTDFDAPASAADVLGDYAETDGTVSTANAAGFVDDLGEAAESSRFFDDLSDADREELDAALESVYDNVDVDTATRQDAAVLAGEIALRGTDAGATVNNVVDVLISSDGGADSFNDPSTLLAAIIPAEVQGDETAIRNILESMVTAADAYESLGSTMTDEDGDGTPDGPDGANMGAVSQNAAVAIIVSAMADSGGGVDALTSAIIDDDFTGFSTTALDDSIGSDASPTPLRNILDAGGLLGVFESE